MTHNTKARKRRFFLKILLFAGLASLLPGSLLWTALVIGEALPPAYVLSLPNDAQFVYQVTGTREDMIAFKLQGTLQRQPDILVLGSSRAYHMRSAMFNVNPDAFYNASFSSATPAELANFVTILAQQDAMPQVLLLMLDLPEFNADRVSYNLEEQPFPVLPLWTRNISQLVDGTQIIGRGWLRNPERLRDHLQHNLTVDYVLLGNPVWRRERGFLADGSQYNARLVPEIIEQGIAEHQTQIAQRISRYEPGATVDAEAVAQIEQILALAQEHGTQVLGIFPPYLDEISSDINASADYAYVPLVNAQLNQLFAAHGFSLYDYSTLSSIGSDDAVMYDGWHSGELAMMQLLYTLVVTQPTVLDNFVDTPMLAQDIEQVENPFFYYVELLDDNWSDDRD